jgi:hypothetical protein
MTFGLGRRSRRLAVLAAVLFVLAGGIAYATIPDSGQTYTACMLKGIGTIRLIDPSLGGNSLLGRCTSLEAQLSWNQKGQPGATGPAGPAGQSPAVAQLASGNANCPAGGAAITDANGSTAYVCNGTNGTNGQPFSGTFTSPNGQYSISVTDTGVTIQHGNHAKIVLADDDVTIQPSADLNLKTGSSLNVRAGNGLSLRSDGDTSVTAGAGFTVNAGSVAALHAGATASLDGAFVQIGGNACRPAARLLDTVANDQITSGSTTVCVGG